MAITLGATAYHCKHADDVAACVVQTGDAPAETLAIAADELTDWTADITVVPQEADDNTLELRAPKKGGGGKGGGGNHTDDDDDDSAGFRATPYTWSVAAVALGSYLGFAVLL